METEELGLIAAKVEMIVDQLKTARSDNDKLRAENQHLAAKITSLEKRVNDSEKDQGRLDELAAQNKTYKKKHGLLKAKVTSMLAKVEVMQ